MNGGDWGEWVEGMNEMNEYVRVCGEKAETFFSSGVADQSDETTTVNQLSPDVLSKCAMASGLACSTCRVV